MALSKGDLVGAVAGATGATKVMAQKALEAMLDAVTKELSKGGSVTLTGFGTFGVSNRAARMGVNPQTGAKIQIPARKAVTFRAGKALKQAVN